MHAHHVFQQTKQSLGRVSISQQIWKSAIYQERRKFRGGVRHLLRHGYPQRPHVRKNRACHGETTSDIGSIKVRTSMRHYLVVGRWLCPFAHCSTPIFVKRSINIHSHFFHDLCYSYHATAALEEAQKLARQKIPSAAALQLHSFTFDDFGLENDEMLQVTKKSFAVHPHFGLFSPNYVGSGCVRGVEKWKKIPLFISVANTS